MTLILAVLATWVITLTCAGLLGLPLGVRIARSGPDVIRLSLWVGLGFLTFAIMALALLLPLKSHFVGIILTAVPLAIGGITMWRTRCKWLRISWCTRKSRVALVLFAAAILILAIGASLAPTHYDFALYHYSGLSWAAQYATVPGLANLNSYLGYSNSATPWSAALMNGPATAQGYAGFAGLWAVALVIDAILRLLSTDAPKRVGTYISLINIVVLFGPLMVFADIFVASPTSDTAVFALLLVSAAALADGVSNKNLRPEAIMGTVIPLLIATSMRPQILLVAGSSSLILLGLAVRDRKSLTPKKLVPAALTTSLTGLALGAVSLARDYRLSGWAIYPLSILPFDVPWRAENPATLRAITIGIARDPGPGYQNAATGYEWLVPWIGRQLDRWEVWILLTLILVAGLLAAVVLKTKAQPHFRSLALTTLPYVLLVLIWLLLLPPTWRHSWGAVFALCSISIGWFAWCLGIPLYKWATGIAVLTLLIGLASLFFRFPTKAASLQPSTLTEVTTDSGLQLLTPMPDDDRCGIAPLLCAPMPSRNLKLRGDDLNQGFIKTTDNAQAPETTLE